MTMANPRRGASLELDRRLARLRSQMRLILQAAIAASVSWELASLAFPNRSPLFAPFAAIVCLASGYGQRARRTLELIPGVALGIGVADLAAGAIGTGWWQLALITLAAMSVAVLLDAGRVFVLQAGLSAMIVVTVQPPGSGLAGQRFLEVLIGGLVALAVSSLVPADPRRALRATAAPLLDEFKETLLDLARALDDRDATRARGALERARGPRRAQSARARPSCHSWHRARRHRPGKHRGRARADCKRRGMPRSRIDRPQPADPRQPLLIAVAAAATALQENGSLSVSAIVGQIRSTATDLLSALGDREDDARWAVRIAAQS
jgi:Fusaric acid resistance protein-like